MFGLGTTELVIILVILLVLFGPTQLPKLGKMLGQTTRSLREGMEAGAEELDAESKPKKKKAKQAAADTAKADTGADEDEEEVE